MERIAYFREAARLSGIFGEKLEALREFIESDPEMKYEGSFDICWQLENAAQAAAAEWTSFCAKERSLITD